MKVKNEYSICVEKNTGRKYSKILTSFPLAYGYFPPLPFLDI